MTDIGGRPGFVYLGCADASPVEDVCDAARKIWPELPPYGGKYNDSRPHVTLALGEMQPGDQEAIAELARPFLPLAVYTDYLHVVAFDGRKWAVRRKFSCGQGG